MKIRGLGYIGFHATDLAPWRSFAEDLLGFMPAAGPAGMPSGAAAKDALYYRLDERSWRIAVHQSKKPGLAYIGWELADRDALTAAADHLARCGVAVERSWPGREERGRRARRQRPDRLRRSRRQPARALLRCADEPQRSLRLAGRRLGLRDRERHGPRALRRPRRPRRRGLLHPRARPAHDRSDGHGRRQARDLHARERPPPLGRRDRRDPRAHVPPRDVRGRFASRTSAAPGSASENRRRPS